MTSNISEINKINAIISDSIDDPIFILNEKLICEYVNFNYFKEKRSIIDFIHPDDSKNTINFIKKSFKIGKGISQSRIKSIGVQFNWYELKARTLVEDNEKKLILLCYNITKYKFFEEEFKKSQTRYSQLADTLPEIKYWKLIQSKEGINAVQKSREMLELVINNIPHLVYWKDKDLVFLGCNSNFAKLNRFENPTFIVGRRGTELNWDKDVAIYIDECERNVIDTNKPEFNIVESLITPDGTRVWFEINRIPLHDLKENVVGILVTFEDITERKFTEQKIKESEEELRLLNEELEKVILDRTKELRESEEKFRHLYENSPYGIVLLNSKGTIVDINDATPSMFGYNKEDLIGKNYFDLIGIYPSDTKSALRELPDLLSQRGALNSKVIPNLVKIFKKDGEIAWVQSEISTIRLGDEILIHIIIQDITEKKIAEEKIRESERQYRTTIDSLGDPLHVIDKDLNIILINKELENWLDQLNISSNLIGKNVFDSFPFLPKKVSEEYKDVINRGITLITTEQTPLPDKDVITDTRKIPIFHEGKVEQVITIIRDITESKEMENQLKESEEKYRNMVNNLDVGFYKGQYLGELLMYNQAAKRILGIKQESSLIGIKSSNMFLNPETYKRYYKDLEEKGVVRNFIAQVRKLNGEIITVSLNAHVIYNSEGLPIEIEGTFIDITEKFTLEQELMDSERKLREQNIELMKMDGIKNDFITMAAHELKTPLISISGYTDYILMKYKNSLTPAIIEDLKTVQRNVKRLELLMDQLLEVMKIDENKVELHKEYINVSKLINDCLDELSYLINEKNLEIILNINHEIILNVDPTRIFTVFTNLISNAIKFTPDYGWIEIIANKIDGGYSFEVKDNGIGLNQEEIGRLFKKFERLKQPISDDKITVKESGTGLGLYITKGIVNLHGGKIYATSEGINKGSSFIFNLPS